MGIGRRAFGWVRRHPRISGTAAIVGVGLAVFIVVWFEPHKLFIDERVDERLPSAAAAARGDGSPPSDEATSEPPEDGGGTPAPARPQTLARGRFRPLEHDVLGQARILELPDGSRYLRFDDLDVSNGPDLRVYLSVLPAPDDWYVYDDEEYLDLGDLKGNVGSQNYQLPGGIDLEKWKSAVIWCRRFSVGFAVAPLDPV
jgi:hypothetical protein